MLPNLLIIGAPKSGTTTLKYALKTHPEIFFAPDVPSKEPHFLTYKSEGWPAWAIKTRSEYEELFQSAGKCVFRAEKSTWYLYSQKSAEFGAQLLSEPKAIALLRNPIDRAFSAFQFNRQNGWEPHSNFLRALEEEYSLAKPVYPPDRMYSKAGIYYEGLQRWINALGADNVHTIVFDDIRIDLATQLSSVFEFLDIKDVSAALARMPPENTTRPVRSSLIVKIKKRLSWSKAIIPLSVANSMARSVDRLNARKKKPEVPIEAARFLAEAHAEDVSMLSELLDRDLIAEWLDEYL